jgi:hypothetical protein
MKWVLALCVFFSAARAGAQIIFLPVQYQYGEQNKFYYGGSDPAVFDFAQQPGSVSWGQINGFAFYGGSISHFREVSSQPLRTYSDQIPGQNAALYGYTASDARNDAEANVPRYFRKRDLLAAGVRQPDGTIVIPAQAQPVPAAPAGPRAPTSQPVPILIIPGGQPLPAPKSNNIVIVKN